jgi:RHS repeat-associated protein
VKNIGQPHVPLGLQIGLKDKYLFNGKELQEDFGLYQYDFGAHTYDPQLARWFSVDPLASERSWMSPYNFVQNIPILRIDPDGQLDGDYYLLKKEQFIQLMPSDTFYSEFGYGYNYSYNSKKIA